MEQIKSDQGAGPHNGQQTEIIVGQPKMQVASSLSNCYIHWIFIYIFGFLRQLCSRYDRIVNVSPPAAGIQIMVCHGYIRWINHHFSPSYIFSQTITSIVTFKVVML